MSLLDDHHMYHICDYCTWEEWMIWSYLWCLYLRRVDDHILYHIYDACTWEEGQTEVSRPFCWTASDAWGTCCHWKYNKLTISLSSIRYNSEYIKYQHQTLEDQTYEGPLQNALADNLTEFQAALRPSDVWLLLLKFYKKQSPGFWPLLPAPTSLIRHPKIGLCIVCMLNLST